MDGYDIIGDIHGEADSLEELLTLMGYRMVQGAWRQSGRQAVFVGDLIDRGPRQLDTISIVRGMIDAGSATAIMGNHEFNAIAWYVKDPSYPERNLRSHDVPSNYKHHEAFLRAVDGKPSLHKELIDWFMTLPLWAEFPGFRAVHACWHDESLNFLRHRLTPELRLTDGVLVDASRKPDKEAIDTQELSAFKAVDCILKGPEASLPSGTTVVDHAGTARSRVRLQWWDHQYDTFRKAALIDEERRGKLPDLTLPAHKRIGYRHDKPVFFGHYWLSGMPGRLSTKVACLDYSIAKGEKLCAYRWQGEDDLQQDHFVWVEGRDNCD
jgi:hypothetical protein